MLTIFQILNDHKNFLTKAQKTRKNNLSFKYNKFYNRKEKLKNILSTI